MARDHRTLRVFHEAHRLVVAIYKKTRDFPRDEWFGMRAQMRRAAVGIPSNIVEGSARRSTREYCNFLNIARASASELAYLVDLSYELEFMSRAYFEDLKVRCDQLLPQLESLLQSVELLVREETRSKRAKGTARTGPRT